MKLPEIDPAFVLAILGSVVIKLRTSRRLGLVAVCFVVFAAVFSAVAFTDLAAFLLGIGSGNARYGLAALLALTGEGLMRALIGYSNDPKSGVSALAELIRAWRGTGGKDE